MDWVPGETWLSIYANDSVPTPPTNSLIDAGAGSSKLF